MKPHTGGSVLNNRVAPEILEERAKRDFDPSEMHVIWNHNAERLAFTKELFKYFEKPELRNSHTFFEMTPYEQQIDLWKKINVILAERPELFYNYDVAGLNADGWWFECF